MRHAFPGISCFLRGLESRVPMSVLGVTIFVSMMLALFFVAAFLYHHDFSGGDTLRDSLLPFRKEKTNPPPAESDPAPPDGPAAP